MVLPMTPGWAAGSAAMVEPGSSLLSTWRAEYLPKPMPASSSAWVPRPYSSATLSKSAWVYLESAILYLRASRSSSLLADLDGALALVLVDPVLDLVAGAGGFGEAEPVAAGSVAGLGGDFDDVAVAEFGAERDDAAVDLGADGGVADFGVDGVGEVDGAGVLGQHDDFALGGEGVDLLGVQVDLEGRHELVGVGHFALPLHELADPGEAGLVLGGDVVAGLVLPVGGDAFLGDAVHLLGADLDLELMAAGGDERGVERLVEVGPGHRDEVLDAAGDGTPDGVKQAEDGVAVLHGLADDADGEKVVDLVDGDLLVGELLLDGVEALDAPLDAAGDFVLAELGFEFPDDAPRGRLSPSPRRVSTSLASCW